jgi:hypothetical protein
MAQKTEGEEPIDGVALLERLFAVVLEEARFNKGFATRLISALPRQAVVRIATQKRTKKPKEIVSLVRLLRMEGEDALKAYLKKRNRVQLKAIAERQQIPVAETVFSQQPDEVRGAMVDGVKFRIADRRAAGS